MTHVLTRTLAAAMMLAATSTVAASQDTTHAQHKQDSTKKGMMHDMSKMKDHDMSAMMEKMGGAWKEMNAFHRVLAATYHPASKDSLQPLRDKGADLAAAAKTWAESTAPSTCSSEAITKSIAMLNTDAQSIAQQVKAKASDSDLKERITALHTLFESVEMKCGGHDMKEMKH